MSLGGSLDTSGMSHCRGLAKLGTYIELEFHSSRNFAIHFCFFESLVVLVIGSLANVNDSPGKAVLERTHTFEVDLEADLVCEGRLCLLHYHVEHVY